ncbi:MAG TPA: carbonic anhydrase [Actinomycetota bacterium]|nr:carbonic anhydrase [Actinomycetota bacterium]
MDDLLANNDRYSSGFRGGDLSSSPARKLVVLSCMDARIDVHQILGLDVGDAHVIRNAGGSLTEDTTRSLVLSNLMGTETAVVIQHTDCRMRASTEEEFAALVTSKTGMAPPFELGALGELEQTVHDAITEIRESRLLPFSDVRGYVYDVRSGLLREITA